VAHTAEERIPKQQLLEAVNIYERMTSTLISQAGN
jgi:acetylornithine deacetylase/succinyl-diaminopimelate desuccinylase-like protein